MAAKTSIRPARDVRGELLGLDEPGRALRRVAFLAMLQGESVTLGDLARRAGVAPEAAEELVVRGLATLVDDGTLAGAAGLSRVPVPGRSHRLTVGDRAWWTWCAVDAVGIPAALCADAVAESTCCQCGVEVRVVLAAGAVADASHPDTRLWNAEHVDGRSLAGGTCGLMNLFCSPAHLATWRVGHPDEHGQVLDLVSAVEMGRTWWGPLLEGRIRDAEVRCP